METKNCYRRYSFHLHCQLSVLMWRLKSQHFIGPHFRRPHFKSPHLGTAEDNWNQKTRIFASQETWNQEFLQNRSWQFKNNQAQIDCYPYVLLTGEREYLFRRNWRPEPSWYIHLTPKSNCRDRLHFRRKKTKCRISNGHPAKPDRLY